MGAPFWTSSNPMSNRFDSLGSRLRQDRRGTFHKALKMFLPCLFFRNFHISNINPNRNSVKVRLRFVFKICLCSVFMSMQHQVNVPLLPTPGSLPSDTLQRTRICIVLPRIVPLFFSLHSRPIAKKSSGFYMDGWLSSQSFHQQPFHASSSS